jgi:hypothetical protein
VSRLLEERKRKMLEYRGVGALEAFEEHVIGEERLASSFCWLLPSGSSILDSVFCICYDRIHRHAQPFAGSDRGGPNVHFTPIFIP